jgi:hypothetical protein
MTHPTCKIPGFKSFGWYDGHRTAEDPAFVVAEEDAAFRNFSTAAKVNLMIISVLDILLEGGMQCRL